MQNLWREKRGVYDVVGGADITSTITEAVALAAKKRREIKFEFNGVMITVCANSRPELVYRDWSRACRGYTDKNVGPYPNPALTDEERARDARIEAKNERERQKRQAEYDKQARANRERVEIKLINTSAIELADEVGWQKLQDNNPGGYGDVVAYAERWARLMQAEMANGQNLEDVAGTMSEEADLEGITGLMYGCAVSTLAHYWKHGERLRRWHNLKTQIGSEGEKANESGGVLNPALLVIG